MVVDELPTKFPELLKKLEASAISGMFVDPSGQWISIDFTSSIGEPSIVVKLFNPAVFKFSRTLDDEGLFVVGGVSLSSLGDGGKDVLKSLGYDYKNERGDTVSYQSRALFHFHLEGDICIDVVCENYELLQAVKL